MRTIRARYCAGCRKILKWAGLFQGSRYCGEGCRRGACTCRPHPYLRMREKERRRDVYRIP